MAGEGSSLLLRGGFTLPLAQTTALVSRFTTPPTQARLVLINQTFTALINAGLLAKLDVLCVRAAADSQAARQNWIQNAFNSVATNTPTFVADRGYTGDGASSFLNTNFTPSTAGGLWSQNSASLGVWSLTDLASNGIPVGASGPLFSCVNPWTASNTALYRMSNNGANSSAASTTSLGLFSVSRASSTTQRVYRNGVQLGTGAVNSTGIDSTPVRVLAGGGTFDIRQVAADFAGADLTTADQLALYNALNPYMMAVGAV